VEGEWWVGERWLYCGGDELMFFYGKVVFIVVFIASGGVSKWWEG
jgi:hypothetical protein